VTLRSDTGPAAVAALTATSSPSKGGSAVSVYREDLLHEILRFRPWPNGDPGPEIYKLIQEELSAEQRVSFVNGLIGIELAMTEARLGGLKELQQTLGGRAGKG
jgi:hypothetical protein